MKTECLKGSIRDLCSIVGVSRSGYYDWLKRAESLRSKANHQLLSFIKISYHASDRTYGAIRIHRDLKREGHSCSKNRVARLMSFHGIKSIHRLKYKPQTTQSRHNHPIAANLMNQDFKAKDINQKWGSDISYIKTSEGFLYLAIVMDFHSRKVVGFSMGSSLHAELCCQALKQALVLRQPPAELVHHSDRGVQYASLSYRSLLQDHDLIQSMSRRGNCYDNAMVESFFHTLKVERVYRRNYKTREEAKTDVANYIINFYNNRRLHSSLDYKSPVEFENFYKSAS